MAAGTYVYGVTLADAAPPKGTGIKGARVRAVASDEVAAIVSDLDEDSLRAGRDALMAHARVLEKALDRGVVLPMRFGIVLANEEAVREELLERHRRELVGQLELFAGKVELHLRGTYEETALMKEIVEAHPEIASLRDSLRGQPQDATYFERLRLGEMVAGAVELRREADSVEIIGRLAPLALDMAVGEGRNERVVLSASFLVESAKVSQFDAAVDQVGAHNAERIRFKYTGPLPPHSFVELPLQA